MIEKVKCPVHGELLELQSSPDGTRFAVCICDTNGMLNRWHGVAVLRTGAVSLKSEEVIPEAIIPEATEEKKFTYKRSNK